MKVIRKNFSGFPQSHDSFRLSKSPRKQKGSIFSFSKIGNTCIKIWISDLHSVKLPPIYIFQIYPKSNFMFVFERFECICTTKFIKKNLFDHMFSQKLAIKSFSSQNHMFLTSETVIVEISKKNYCIHNKSSRNFCFYQIEPFRIVLEIRGCKISLFEQLSRILSSHHCIQTYI